MRDVVKDSDAESTVSKRTPLDASRAETTRLGRILSSIGFLA